MNFLLYLPSLLGIASAVILAIHHFVIHRDPSNPKNEHAQRESCACVCFFQLSDISNHETWIVASLVFALSWFLAILTCPC